MEDKIEKLEKRIEEISNWCVVSNEQMLDLKKNIREAIQEYNKGNSAKALDILEKSASPIYITYKMRNLTEDETKEKFNLLP